MAAPASMVMSPLDAVMVTDPEMLIQAPARRWM
jgi:hypothetical protein